MAMIIALLYLLVAALNGFASYAYFSEGNTVMGWSYSVAAGIWAACVPFWVASHLDD